jgi:chemotaxis signal transduction protein
VLNYHGDILPVFDVRRWAGVEPRPLKPTDQSLLVRTGGMTLVLPVDTVDGVQMPERVTSPRGVGGGGQGVGGMVASDEGTLVVGEPSRMLSEGDLAQLRQALEEAGP